MHDEQPRPVSTGGDPRSLSEFMALSDEMSKLTHPARPDVNWKQVDALSLSLFEINGVELQTASWYTLARTHLARVSGMNEGLAILTALLNHQWAQLWPPSPHRRAEILNGLLQQLQTCFRTFSLAAADVPALELAEKRLGEMKEILRRQELNHACQMNPLIQLIRNALSRLENHPHPQDLPPESTAPEPQCIVTEEVTAPASRLMYVIHKTPEVGVQVTEKRPNPPKRWPAFVAGMVTALVLSAATLFGWQSLHRPDNATKAMAASVAWIPEAMTPSQIEAFRKTDNSQTHSAMWLGRITAQINWIMGLSPGWRLHYGQGLISQAKALWPDEPATRILALRWEQYQLARTLPYRQLQGWHEGMTQLRALSAQLDDLDRQKGKYLTGSELKTMVWNITHSFESAVPVEEQLRQLLIAPGEENISRAQMDQTSRHLDSMIHILEHLNDVPTGN